MTELPREIRRTCRTHGVTTFILEGRGYYRCKECRKQRVLDWRRQAKLRLIAEAGGTVRHLRLRPLAAGPAFPPR